MIVDVHTHIFPDKIASKAIQGLEHQYGVKALNTATTSGIRSSMRSNNIDASVLLSVATRPDQVESINDFVAYVSKNDPNLIGLGALHPDYPELEVEIRRMKSMGLKGIKLHSEFQDFYPDDERMFDLYEALGRDMIVVFHAGDEVIPVNEIHTTPARLASVMDSFPELTMVAAHLGGHRCWDDVEQYLLGRNVYFDTAYVFPVPGSEHITVERIREIMETHGFDKIMFGTDYPFRDQGLETMNIMNMDIEEKHKEMILGGNAARLFGINDGDEC